MRRQMFASQVGIGGCDVSAAKSSAPNPRRAGYCGSCLRARASKSAARSGPTSRCKSKYGRGPRTWRRRSPIGGCSLPHSGHAAEVGRSAPQRAQCGGRIQRRPAMRPAGKRRRCSGRFSSAATCSAGSSPKRDANCRALSPTMGDDATAAANSPGGDDSTTRSKHPAKPAAPFAGQPWQAERTAASPPYSARAAATSKPVGLSGGCSAKHSGPRQMPSITRPAWIPAPASRAARRCRSVRSGSVH